MVGKFPIAPSLAAVAARPPGSAQAGEFAHLTEKAWKERTAANRRLRTTDLKSRSPSAPTGVCNGKENHRILEAAGACRGGKPVAPDRPGAGPARPQHYGVLQGV